MPPPDPRAGELRRQLRGQLQRLAEDGLWAIPVAAAGRASEPDAEPESHAEFEPSAKPAPPGAAATSWLPHMPSADALEPGVRLAQVAREVEACTACGLCRGRNKVVVGVGNPRARLMFIGEGPGREEDRRGEPFVGAAGKKLDDMIVAMKTRRQDVYIANAVKCRPPNNRNPEPDELDSCRPFLLRQIAAIQPEVIVLLGRVAAQSVLGTDAPLGRLRGRFLEFEGIPVMCTYHPAFLLRQPEYRRDTWNDLQMVMGLLDGASS